jgi:hypothetical protein
LPGYPPLLRLNEDGGIYRERNMTRKRRLKEEGGRSEITQKSINCRKERNFKEITSR